VYDYVLSRQHTRRRIFACKGVDYPSKPGLVMEGFTKKANIRLFAVATYAAKDRVFARMKIPRPGPGYMHLPEWVTDEYLEQLTGEKKITVRDKRTRTKKVLYVKTYSRNEAPRLTPTWPEAEAGHKVTATPGYSLCNTSSPRQSTAT
jgi:phage terminase large subunit GpA-like protein